MLLGLSNALFSEGVEGTSCHTIGTFCHILKMEVPFPLAVLNHLGTLVRLVGAVRTWARSRQCNWLVVSIGVLGSEGRLLVERHIPNQQPDHRDLLLAP